MMLSFCPFYRALCSALCSCKHNVSLRFDAAECALGYIGFLSGCASGKRLYIRFIQLKGVIHHDESELTYVSGGSVLPDAWGVDNVKTFSTNIVTIIGNTYVQKLVNATLGVMFGGNFAGDGVTFGDGIKHYFGTADMNGFNKFLTGVGISAAVYELGTASTGSTLSSSNKMVDANGKKYKHSWGADGLQSVYDRFVNWAKVQG